tara:strand:- start:3011 stop:3229 length:219 start_codon:yes stop_codon:yes gene_type:complete
MLEQEALFDMTPDENTGKIEQTEIEYLQLAFSDDKKKEMIIMLESVMSKTDYDVYPDLLFNLLKEKYEKINS